MAIFFNPTDTEPTSTAGGVYYDLSEKSLKHYDGTNWGKVDNYNVDRPGDGVYSLDGNTVFLLRSDAANDSGVFTDISTNNITITKGSAPKHLTAQKKFGTSSMKFDGTDDYLTIPYNASNTITMPTGAAARTIDYWWYPINTGAGFTFGMGAGGSNGTVFGMNTTGAGNYVFQGYGSADNDTSFAVTINVWAHVAAVYDGTKTYVFINGILRGEETVSINTGGTILVVGGSAHGSGNTPSEFMAHYIDEFRVSNVARWTSNFTVY